MAPSTPAELPGFNLAQLDKAINSLIKFVGEQDRPAQLLEDDETLHLVVALKRAPTGPRKDKPIPLPLPHALWSAEGAEFCLFVKDHKGEGHKAAKARLAKLAGSGGIAKVVGLSKLRTKYESHEAKRALCGAYDLFLADDRVLPSLPKLLGKSFFKRKKQPLPVDLRAKDFAAQVSAALMCTTMTPPTGTCVSVRFARVGMGAAAAADNALAALAGVVAHVPKRWANVQAVYVKTGESVALPVYQTLPDAPMRITAATDMVKSASGKSSKQQPATPVAAAAAAAVAVAGQKQLPTAQQQVERRTPNQKGRSANADVTGKRRSSAAPTASTQQPAKQRRLTAAR
jgi:ribosome biogenesis protein UTP30